MMHGPINIRFTAYIIQEIKKASHVSTEVKSHHLAAPKRK
jgi:hypothetical protein